MKFKDLFKTKDNTGYEVRISTGINCCTPQRRSPERVNLYVVEYKPEPRYIEVFINRPWYQRQTTYIVY